MHIAQGPKWIKKGMEPKFQSYFQGQNFFQWPGHHRASRYLILDQKIASNRYNVIDRKLKPESASTKFDLVPEWTSWRLSHLSFFLSPPAFLLHSIWEVRQNQCDHHGHRWGIWRQWSPWCNQHERFITNTELYRHFVKSKLHSGRWGFSKMSKTGILCQ